jgi:peptide deformylase
MNLPIVTHPNDSMLRSPSKEVSQDDLQLDTTRALIQNMIDTMHAANGIGIAAPQVNAAVRICIINKEAFPKRFKLNGSMVSEDIALINPTWERMSRKHDTDIEGCLSIPGKLGRVKRWKDISVTATLTDGTTVLFEAHNYLARVIQHEVDHLNGVLYIDRTEDVWNDRDHKIS